MILGIDPSLTRTGLALLNEGAIIGTDVIVSDGRRSDRLTARHKRIRGILNTFIDWAPERSKVSLAIIEGPSFGAVGGSAWDRAGLWWGFVQLLLAWEIPTAVCSPTTRAKWATGDGRADKAAVSSAMTRLSKRSYATSDEADAAALAWAAGVWTGVVPGPRRDALTAIAWPKGLDS